MAIDKSPERAAGGLILATACLLNACFPPALDPDGGPDTTVSEVEVEVVTHDETDSESEGETQDETASVACLTDDGCSHLDEVCIVGRCRSGTCVAKQSDDTSCDDLDPCTVHDKCEPDGCIGAPKSCDDQLDCTNDSCGESGECMNTLMDDHCLIDGECIVSGTRSETLVCHVCVEGGAWTSLAPLDCHPECGDGLVTGDESCDVGLASVDGCSGDCHVVTGFECEGEPSVCRTRCGDSLVVGREACDDGANVGGDGCSPDCEVEPGFGCDTNGCRPICGDGWRMGAEACDDENLVAGDGCSPFCEVELGWMCSEITWGQDGLSLPLRVFDFKASTEEGGHPDFQAYLGHSPQMGLVLSHLDSEDRPVFATRGVPFALTGLEEFAQWYRYVPGLNMYFELALDLGPASASRDTYFFQAPTFFPIDGEGFGNYANYEHNFHFTTHTRFRFEYQGGEDIRFSGDDDVWIFVNRRLAVDLGGTHGPASGGVTLSDSVDPLTGYRRDANFDLHEGAVYEIHVFHAERFLVGSSYRLDLSLKRLRGNRSECVR